MDRAWLSTFSSALQARGWRVRSEQPGDRPFLADLYASTRFEDMKAWPWPEARKTAFLAMQFDAQRRHYQANLPGADWLILIKDGIDAGRLYLDDRKTDVHLVDITLAPDLRSGGHGGDILRTLIKVTDASAMGVTLSVDKLNRAKRLYDRLGFVDGEDHGLYLAMARQPPKADELVRPN